MLLEIFLTRLICLLPEFWIGYFSWSAKPGFFHEESRANLFEVEPQSGMLINTDNGTPMAQVWFLRNCDTIHSLSHAISYLNDPCVYPFKGGRSFTKIFTEE